MKLCPPFQAKVVIAEQTEKDIDETRSQYIPVAVRTQILFFCTYDLVSISFYISRWPGDRVTATFKSITKNILSHPLPEINICTGLLKGLIHLVKIEKKGPVKLISPIALLFKLYFHLFSRLT